MSTSTETRPDHASALSMWLDAFRWISAFLVVFTHANNRFLVKIFSLPSPERSALHYLFALASGFGHQAVVVFFVMSGMFVGGGSLRSLQRKGRLDGKDYIAKRLTRLWLVLLPSFATTFFFDAIGMSLWPSPDTGPYVPAPLHGPDVLLCNAAFLQTAFCNQYGNNGALWSLFNEFWYYAAWLLVLVGLVSFATWPKRVLFFFIPALVLLVLSAFQFVGSNIAAYSLIWLLGVSVSARGRPFLAIGTAPMAALFIAYLLLVRGLVPTDWADRTFGVWFLLDSGLALLFGNLILCMKASERVVVPPGGAIHTRLAAFAFSLYCTHTPLLNLYATVMTVTFGLGWQMVPTTLVRWLVVFGGILCAIVFGYLFSLVTETQTDRVRHAMSVGSTLLFRKMLSREVAPSERS